MLYQTLFAYKYDNGGRPTRVNVDELVNYPSDYVYVVFEGESRPTKMLISDLQADGRNYDLYTVDEENDTSRSGKSRTLGTSWADKMIRSYQKLHPEQKVWFDMITVDTIADRDALQYDSDFAPESWIRVRNDENGESHEYVLAANRQFWVDTGIIGLAEASGKTARDELYNRLSSGYLLNTFGPSGQDKSVCDFVYVLGVKDDLTARTWTKTGNIVRWDFGDGTPVSNNGVPSYTVPVDEDYVAVTLSTEDSFDTITAYQFYNSGFVGAIPLLDFKNTTDISNCFRDTNFSGPLPPLDVSSVTAAARMAKLSLITSFNDLIFNSLNATSGEMFFGTKITNKMGKISIPNPVNIFSMFRASTITRVDVDIETDNNSSINFLFKDCTNLNELRFRDSFIDKLSYNNILINSSSSTSSYSRVFGNTNIRDYGFVNRKDTGDVKLFDLIRGNLDTFSFTRNLPRFSITDINDDITLKPYETCTFSHSPFMSSHAIDNFLRLIYERRFITKATQASSIILMLQSFVNSINGKYENVNAPKYANEFIYKLVENPDNENINDYEVFYNQDGRDLSQEAIITSYIDTPKTINFKYFYNSDFPQFSKNGKLYVDWGDGDITEFALGFGSSGVYEATHDYASSGNYDIKIYGDINSDALYSIVSSALTVFSGIVIKNITVNSPYGSTFFNTFENMTGLENIYFNTNRNNVVYSPDYARRMFKGCTSLRHIDPFYLFNEQAGWGSVTTQEMFMNTGNIESVVINGIGVSFDISNNKLNGVALNALFEGLGTPVDPQTVTITGNPGIADPEYDPSIATAKNWTVVDA